MQKTGRFTVLESVEMWRRYKAGETLLSIGQSLGRSNAIMHNQMKLNGGVIPPPKRSPRVLSFAEREEISRGIAAKRSYRQIAKQLGRAPSTICREVRRHGGSYFRCFYRARRADWRAWDRAKRPKPCVLGLNRRLQMLVAAKLKLDWSPQQISGWLKA